jgi:hypothetical protein
MEPINQPPASEPKTAPKKPRNRIGLVILRLLLTVLLAVILGGVVYYSAANWLPFFNDAIIQPAGLNPTWKEGVQSTLSSLESQFSELKETMDSSLSEDSAHLSESLATQDSINRDLQILAETLNSLQATVEMNQQIMISISTVYPQMLETLSARQSTNSQYLEVLATAQMASSREGRQLELLKILELLSRATQFLLHSNHGLAKDTLDIALIELTELQKSSPGYQQEYIQSLIDLVESAADDLPTKPDLAAEKIELAWRKGIEGFPEPVSSEADITRTPTPYPPDFTPTPTPP